MSDTQCVFCMIVENKIASPRVFENQAFIAINDRAPKAPVHILIIPKKHIVNLNEAALFEAHEALDFFSCVQALADNNSQNKAFNLISNNGALAGQSVFHLHWHFISGKRIYEGGFSL